MKRHWIIKSPHPNSDKKLLWGDYYFALSIKRSLEAFGDSVSIHDHDHWQSPEKADIILVLRGIHPYTPDRSLASCYVMWNISHPDSVPPEEYELYDRIFVSSLAYSKALQARLHTPVYPLLQCTDSKLFYLLPDECKLKNEFYLFIGNARSSGRACIEWAIDAKLPLKIWGKKWAEYLPASKPYLQASCIANQEIRSQYIRAKASLNNHWGDMLKHQFINNRIFDTLACGLPVITEYMPDLYKLFPSPILFYKTKAEFFDCIEKLENQYDYYKTMAINASKIVHQKHTFLQRMDEMLSIINNS